LWVWCGPQGFLLAWGSLDLHRASSVVSPSSSSATNVIFLTYSATSRPQPIRLGRLREERQRRCAVDTV
jgi:hypothetical protein